MTLTEPYSFDLAYARCFAVPEVAMDKRHVFMLYEVLRRYPFRAALEIGSFNGASATAFVEAINGGTGLGESGTATFCDIRPTHSLMDVARNCRFPDRARITKRSSCEVLDADEPYDFVLVDGCHDAESVARELMRLIVRKPLCVVAHDTNATAAGLPLCEGAALLKHTFQCLPGYQCVEDAAERPDELTHRGLFLATTHPELYQAATQVFADLG